MLERSSVVSCDIKAGIKFDYYKKKRQYDFYSNMTSASTQIKLKMPKEKLNRKQITKVLKSQVSFAKHTYENL